ncbi:MAG TPA: ABC transporter ATP-binding protein [Salinisphaeraceae bacterium]|nr:ABC transporter ATP-binding protein [Salinisphaeraceae bacterium]
MVGHGSKLEVVGLDKTFPVRGGQPVHALENINVSVRNREFLSLLGPSGCGKSTLLRIVAGLEVASAGSVDKEGTRVTGPGADRGMVFQAFSLFPWLTVQKNVEFGPSLSGVDKSVRAERARHLLEHFGLGPFADKYPKALSGGMKQRVALARAIANDPEILLMDEPFGALDAQTRASMQEFVLQVWQENQKTVLFVTHDIDEALFISDRILVMKTRPGRVSRIIDIDLPRPRDYDMQFSARYLELKRELSELIRAETRAGHAA